MRVRSGNNLHTTREVENRLGWFRNKVHWFSSFQCKVLWFPSPIGWVPYEVWYFIHVQPGATTNEKWSQTCLSSIFEFEDVLYSTFPSRTPSLDHWRFLLSSSYHSSTIPDPSKWETKRSLVTVSVFLSFCFLLPVKRKPRLLRSRKNGNTGQRGIPGLGPWLTFSPTDWYICLT